MKKIPFAKPYLVGKELDYIAQAVETGSISGDGLFTKRCHDWLQEKLGSGPALLTHSCTAALEMAAILCDISPGDEVIMPSFTFVSTANAFVLRGGVPVFVDINPDTLNMDESLVEAAITSRTKAIVPVHYAGVACNMDVLMQIATRHNLWLIEDAAQGLLSKYNGRYLGAIGHLGCLSFHETKNVISGEGGALLVNDERLIARAEIIREKGTNRKQFFQGQVDKYTWVDIGSSYLPSELISAFLYAQLERAEEITAKRMEIYKYYYDHLKPLEKLGFFKLPDLEKSGDFNAHIFFMIVNSREERNALIEHLKKEGIHAVFHYVPLHSAPAGEIFGRAYGRMDVTDRVSDCMVRLPIFYEMTEDQLLRIVREVQNFYCGDIDCA